MNKTYHFLAGLPRSGNTVLSALLNQHPEIYSSPLSPVLPLISNMHNELYSNEEYERNGNNFERTSKVISNFTNIFYSDVNKPIVLDRYKGFGSDATLFLTRKYINPNFKIIFTVRDVTEVLASFITIGKDKEWSSIDFLVGNYEERTNNLITKDDVRCDAYMALDGQIMGTLDALNNLMKQKVSVCLIEYNDLVNTPQETLKRINTYLEVSSHEYVLNNVVKSEDDKMTSLNPLDVELHTIRKEIKRISPSSKEILSSRSYNKYSNMEFWRNEDAFRH